METFRSLLQLLRQGVYISSTENNNEVLKRSTEVSKMIHYAKKSTKLNNPFFKYVLSYFMVEHMKVSQTTHSFLSYVSLHIHLYTV